MFHAILNEAAPDVCKLNPHVSNDLKIVVETSIEKTRDLRYQTAFDLSNDLKRVRLREPIVAKAAGPLLRLTRWVQRNPLWLA